MIIATIDITKHQRHAGKRSIVYSEKRYGMERSLCVVRIVSGQIGIMGIWIFVLSPISEHIYSRLNLKVFERLIRYRRQKPQSRQSISLNKIALIFIITEKVKITYTQPQFTDIGCRKCSIFRKYKLRHVLRKSIAHKNGQNGYYHRKKDGHIRFHCKKDFI